MRPELCPQVLFGGVASAVHASLHRNDGVSGQGLARVEYYLKAGRL